MDAAVNHVKTSILNDMRHPPFGPNVQTVYLDTFLEFNGMIPNGHGLDMGQISRNDRLPQEARKASAIRVMDEALTGFGAIAKGAFNGLSPQEASMVVNIIGSNIIKPGVLREGEIAAQTYAKMNTHVRVAARETLRRLYKGASMNEAVFLGMRDASVGANTTYDHQTSPATAFMLAAITQELQGKDQASQEAALKAIISGKRDWRNIISKTEPFIKITPEPPTPTTAKGGAQPLKSGGRTAR